jgi:RNA polymerase sigma-70 factor (ECF subfamily)
VDTDDMIQDTLMRTIRNLDNFVPRCDGALGAYLRQALNNRIRDEVRKFHMRPRREELHDHHFDDGASPLEETIGSEALKRYEDALGRLAAEERELVLARIEMCMTYDEIASATDKPTADAARMAVGRALLRLAKEMDRA